MPSCSPAAARHYVFVASPMWGHLRPQLSSACHLLARHDDLHITLLLQPSSYEAVIKEAAAHSFQLDGRLTLITALSDWPAGLGVEPLALDTQPGKGSPRDVFQALLTEQPVKVWDRGRHAWVETIGIRPCLYNFDMFCQHLSFVARQAADKAGVDLSEVPRLMAFPSTAASAILHFADAPAGLQSSRIIDEAIAELEQRSPGSTVGKTEEEVVLDPRLAELVADRFLDFSGRITDEPGSSPMFDYEHFPSLGSVPFAPSIAVAVSLAIRWLRRDQTGIILPWASEVLEPGAVERFRALMPNHDVFAIGPQGPESLWSETPSISAVDADDRVVKFLDRILETKGERKALYISFGSLFFPSLRPDLIVHLVNSLMELQIPFVFALASPFAVLPEDLVRSVEASGLGCFSRFAPQAAVLVHRATGWFLTHGGSNSTSEALISGVPCCMWPALADQPCIAGKLSQDGLAFELVQVRTGPCVGKPTHRGVDVVGTPEAIVAEMRSTFARMFSPEGETVRVKVEWTSRALREDRREGVAFIEMDRLGRVAQAAPLDERAVQCR